MSVANLTKYAMFGDGDMCAVKDSVDNIQRYVKFEEAMEASSNSLQQLKAEIAADMKNVLFNHQYYSHTELVAIIEGWQRQLSAV